MSNVKGNKLKTIIAILSVSIGLLLGCQDKTVGEDKGNAKMTSEMNQGTEKKMEGKMNHTGEHDHSSMEQEETIAYYTCPMESHKHIHSPGPGSCSECGMKLVPALEVDSGSADFFGCPMPEHSHVRSDKPGSCTECGMALIPLKLG